MSDKEITEKAEELVNRAKSNNLIKSYNEFANSEEFKEWAVNEEEAKYYASKLDFLFLQILTN